jgi:GABA permease
MTWKRNVLVVANVTATSDELVKTLQERAAREPISVQMIIPATPFGGGSEAASKQLDDALRRLLDAGLDAQGSIGHGDPMVAVTDAWDPKRYDEIIVSTLPMRFSKWLHAGLPERISRLTGAPVTHVVCAPPKSPPEAAPPPQRDAAAAAMGPLSVLAWGGNKHR